MKLTTDSIDGNVDSENVVTAIRHIPILSRTEHPDPENPKTLKPETPPISMQERPSLWDQLKSVKLDMILLLPVTLGISVFVALVAVNRCTNCLESRSEPNNVRVECRPTNRFSDVPLIPPISSDLQSLPGYGRSCNTKYHVYEEIK